MTVVYASDDVADGYFTQGWIAAAMHDPTEDRSLFFRVVWKENEIDPDTGKPILTIDSVDVRVGNSLTRPYVSISINSNLTTVDVDALAGCLNNVSWMCPWNYGERDGESRMNPSVAAIVRTQQERDAARAIALRAMEDGLAECERLRSENERLRNSLSFYGQHADDCGVPVAPGMKPTGVCDCGLFAALAARSGA